MAVYTFSRNLSRTAALTKDRNEAISGLRKAVAGDDAALYNALLLLALARCGQGAWAQGGDRVLEWS